jgi:hypothetical protein
MARPASRRRWGRCRWWPASAAVWTLEGSWTGPAHPPGSDADPRAGDLCAGRQPADLPTPLRRVEDWAQRWAVEETFGIAPETLNDDRIGRALDAIAPNLDQIVGSVGAQAIAAFGVQVARLHWDMTSISLYGAYEDPEEGFIAPRFGHPKDRRPDLNQVQTGLGVSGDGGVPVWHRAYDGGAAQVAQVAGAMRALRELAGQRRFLLVGDSKLVSYANLAAIGTAGVDFIAPASKIYVPAQVLAALDPVAATPVDYLAERDAGKPPEQRGSYRVLEDTMALAGPRNADPVLHLRRVLCGPAPGLRRRPPPGPRSERAPATTLAAWNEGWAAATILTLPRCRRAWPRLPRPVGWLACWAPRSGSTSAATPP